MPDINQVAAKPAYTAVATATHAVTVITLLAPSRVDLHTIFVTGFTVTASGSIAAPVTITLSGVQKADGTTSTLSFALPVGTLAPFTVHFGGHPLTGVPGTNVVLTVPDLGSGITCSAFMNYYVGLI